MVAENASKAGSIPASERNVYIPPGSLARGRGKPLQNLYPSKFELRGDGRSTFKPTSEIIGSSQGQNSKKRSRDSSSGTSFNPNHSMRTIVDNYDKETSLDPLFGNCRDKYVADDDDYTSDENVEDDGDNSSGDEDLHPISQLHGSNNQLNKESMDDGEAKVKEDKRRGRNKCLQIAKLKAGDKIPITFYNNRAVGENYSTFVRHLGIIVRDTNICPIKVRKWKDIGEREKEHMWRAVTDVFSNENMEIYRQHVLGHMYELWIKRRAELLRTNVTKKNITLKEARKVVPTRLTREEWEWLIDEVYSTEEYKEKSKRNSANRKGYKKELLHRTGSKPYRQVAWDLGAKTGANYLF